MLSVEPLFSNDTYFVQKPQRMIIAIPFTFLSFMYFVAISAAYCRRSIFEHEATLIIKNFGATTTTNLETA